MEGERTWILNTEYKFEESAGTAVSQNKCDWLYGARIKEESEMKDAEHKFIFCV